MALLISIVAISIDALLPALGFIAKDMALQNVNRAQLLIGIIFGGLAIGELIAGPMSDAFGRKPILYGGLLVYFIGSFVCYSASDFNILLIGRFIQGLGVAGPYVTTLSVVRDTYSGDAMARAMSFIMMIFMLVPAIAPSLGQGILYIADWRAIFILYILYAVVVGLWITLRLKETLPKEKRLPLKVSAFWHGLQTVLRNRTTMVYMLCNGFGFGSIIAYLGASQQIFQNQFGVGEAFALYFGALALVLGVASLVNAHMVERLGMRWICQASAVLVVGASVLWIVLMSLGVSETLPLFVAYMSVLFFAFGLMFGNLNAIAMEPMGDVAGMASALIGCISSLMSLAIGTAIGQLYTTSVMPIVVGFLLCNVMTWGLIRAEQKSEATAP
jgi:MFS transporter, DHA1 family, multidrug resistance protein